MYYNDPRDYVIESFVFDGETCGSYDDDEPEV